MLNEELKQRKLKRGRMPTMPLNNEKTIKNEEKMRMH